MAERRAPDAQAPIEQALGQGVAQVMAVAENYPDLKASDQFLALQHALVDTEDRIQVARRIYNANVRSYNDMVQSFPSMIVANAMRYEPRPFFEIDRAVREAGPPLGAGSGPAWVAPIRSAPTTARTCSTRGRARSCSTRFPSPARKGRTSGTPTATGISTSRRNSSTSTSGASTRAWSPRS